MTDKPAEDDFDDLFGMDDDAPVTIETLREDREVLRDEKRRLQAGLDDLAEQVREVEEKLKSFTDARAGIEAGFKTARIEAIRALANDLEPVIGMIEKELKDVLPENRAADKKYDKLIEGFEKTLLQLPGIFNKYGVRPAAETAEAPAAETPVEETATARETTDAPAASDAPAATPAEDTLESLGVDCDRLSLEISAMTERFDGLDRNLTVLQRRLADAAGSTDRLREKLEADKPYAISKFVVDCLPVLDTLDLGLQSIPKKLRETDAKFGDLAGDLERSVSHIKGVFNKHGVREMNPLGEEFDETRHEAITRLPAPNVDPDTVIKVSLSGYELAGRVIRPAKVIVSQ